MSANLLYEQSLIGHFRHSKQFYYIITDLKGQVLHANPLFGIRSGYTSGQIPSFSIKDFIDKEDTAKCFLAIERCVYETKSFVNDPLCLREKNTDSEICWELSVLKNDKNGPEAIQWTGVERRNKMADILNQNESFYKNLIADILDAAVLTDENGIISYASSPVTKILGYEPAELLNKSAFDFLHPDDREHSMGSFLREVERSPRARFIYARVRKKTGEWLWCMIRGHNLLSNPYVKAVLINFFDDTLRRNAEMALIESENRLRKQAIILNNVYDLIATTDLELNITSWNKVAEEISGISAQEAIGAHFPDVIKIDYINNTPEQVADIVFSQGIWHGEISFVNRDGEKKFLLQTISLLQEENGIAIGLLGVGKDITEKIKAEEQQRFQAGLYNCISDAVTSSDIEFRVTSWNKYAEEIYGITEQEILGKKVGDLITMNYHNTSREEVIKTILETGLWKGEVSLVRKTDRTLRTILSTITLQRDSKGKAVGIVSVNKDITERKKIEDQLSQQAAILANVSDLILTMDFDLHILSWNKKAEEITGYLAEEAIGRFVGDIARPDYGNITPSQAGKEFSEKKFWQGEVSFLNKYGIKKYLLLTTSYLYNEEGKRKAIIGTGKDITEGKKAQEQLQQSELFYRSMIANSLDGIVMTDTFGQITYCGPSVTKLSGYKTEQILEHYLFEFVHPDDLDIAKEAFLLELRKESVLGYVIMRLHHSDGSWRWCSVRGHNLLNKSGINSMVIYFTEETKRKEIEDRLRESEQRFRQLIHNLSLGVILMDEKGVVLLCNRSSVNILGIPEDKFVGMAILDIDWDAIHEDGSKFNPYDYPAAIAIRTKRAVRDIVMGVTQVGNPERIWLLVNVEVVMGSNDAILYVICSYSDITEKRKLSQQLIDQEIQKQKQLIQATIDGQEKERKEIGRELHDNISQHLTTTRLYLEVAREKTDGETHQMIELAHKRLLDTVSEIRQLSQSLVPPSLSDIGLVESIQDLCSPLTQTHAFNIDFQYHDFNETLLPENMKLTLFRVIQEQINNIIRHADANTIQIILRADDTRVLLTVKDNGKGFDTRTIKRGLGFNNIASRAGLFGGRLRIDTSPGHGCVIHVIIPLLSRN